MAHRRREEEREVKRSKARVSRPRGGLIQGQNASMLCS